MTTPGVTDAIKLLEMDHWLEGQAGEVVDSCMCLNSQYWLDDAREDLRELYGGRWKTAEPTLKTVLDGKELGENEHGLVRTFVLQLKCLYRQAKDTG
jgi:hypothetical protein